MFRKTSSVEFLRYGDVYSEPEALCFDSKTRYSLPVQNQDLIFLYQADQDVCLYCSSGITLLVVSEELKPETFRNFVIHRYIRLRKGMYFNFISLSDKAAVTLAFPEGTKIHSCFFEQEYHYAHIVPRLHIRDLIAYYYNVRSANYNFAGEKNQFWELTYVDSGTLITEIEGVRYAVEENQCIFYAPDQFHTQATEDGLCSYLTVVVGMDIIDQYKYRLMNRVFTCDRDTRKAIEMFVASDSKLSIYDREMMILSLERTILNILKSTEVITEKAASTPMQQKFENEMIEQIVLYINENISEPLSVEDLCDHFTLSRSSLQALFRQNLNTAPKEYISSLKLKKSQALIRESKYTISEIASMLGFSSIHYFSRKFKSEFGISPSEYANKII
ncbi:MAG: AraC family transcriptional regulator [Erysipelotrichaceae bacterium]|nr:AraC family transcriptional regulator [Erysipelotrichaceae bacterium]